VLVGLILFAIINCGHGQTNFVENFESGTLANWTVVASANSLDISTGTNKVPTGGNYGARSTNTLCRMYASSLAPGGLGITAESFKFTYWMYDPGITRAYCEVRSYSGGYYDVSAPSGFSQLLAIGKYNAAGLEANDPTKYQARMGNGTPNGWFNLNAPGCPARSTGWHRFEIERGIYGPSNEKILTFYVDGKVGRVWTNSNANAAWNTVILGSGIGTSAGNCWFDGMQVVSGQAYITQDPQSQTLTIGNDGTFTVSAIGDADTLYYQWRRNGANVVGATDPSYTIFNCQTTNAGSFDVIVTNSLSIKTSLVAVLTVNPPLFVTLSPTNVVINPGESALFTATAVGAGTITYQWKTNGVAIPGQTGDTLSLSSVTTNNTATYTVTVHNGIDPDNTSNPAILVVNTPPVITAIPSQTNLVSSPLYIPITAMDDISVQATPFQDFEASALGAAVLFGNPDYSNVGDPGTTHVTNIFPAGHLSAKTLNVNWTFTNAWLRLTTAGASVNPNPIIWLTTPFKFDIWTSKSLKVALGVRETASTGAIGSNSGGGGQGIDFVGVSAGGTPPSATNIIPAGVWTNVTFDITNCGIGAYTGTGVLDLTTGKGTLEEFALLPGDGSPGAYNVYLDNFVSVPTNAIRFSLDPGAPAGAAIDGYTGAISWTPPAAGVYQIIVRATDILGLSSTQVATVTVASAVSPARITGITYGNPTSITGTGSLGSTFVLVSSTNVAKALNLWGTEQTNSTGAGSFNFSVTPGTDKAKFFRVFSR